MSPTTDSTLADPEQLIADLQRQLAEREAELAEVREQQTATAQRVIGEPDKGALPSETRFHHGLEPFVQHVVQEDVREAG